MPSSNLLSLFDDIAAMMDDVAVMTKKATTKTVGLIGDDLAVNSEQMIGLNASQGATVGCYQNILGCPNKQGHSHTGSPTTERIYTVRVKSITFFWRVISLL